MTLLGLLGACASLPAPDLVIETDSTVGGVADLSCRSDPASPIRWLRDGVEVASGRGSLTLEAPQVVAGRWACEATDGSDAREEISLHAPGGNVLVMLLDDVGIDNFAPYGRAPTPPPIPRLEALTARGVRFDVAWSMPMCSPTRAALMTGRLPHRTGIGTLVEKNDRYALPLAEVTVPEVLRAAGYTSALAGKWHLAPADPAWLTHPGDQGFDWYAGSPGNLQAHLAGLGDDVAGYWHWQKNDNGTAAWTDTYATTDTVDDALDQAATLPEPWFLYVSFNAGHVPYDDPPADLIGAPAAPGAPSHERYAAIVEAMDTEIGRLLDGIDPAVLARTTVVALGDNGSEGGAILPPFDPDRGKGTMLEGGVRVPLIVAGPHVAQPGSVSHAFVDVTDLLPTAAAIAGVALDDGVVRDGISWLPWLADPDRPGARDLLYTEKFEPNGRGPFTLDSRAVKDGTHRLVRRSAEGVEWLFRVAPDALDEGPNLLADGAALKPEDAAALQRLRQVLDRYEAELLP